MRGVRTRRSQGRTVTPVSVLLVLAGFVALTLIVVSPSMAATRYLDGAGTASLVNPPVVPVEPAAPAKAAPEASSSAANGGGIGVPGLPSISKIRCLDQCVSAAKATRGALIRIYGQNLDRVQRIVFPGRKRHIRVKSRAKRAGALRVVVPKRAVRGHVAVVDGSGNRSRSPDELTIMPVSAIPVEVFPVRGTVNFGSGGSRFGAGRPGHRHQGQDVSAACGTRLVSVKRARVLYNTWDDGGGNYVVLANKGENTSFVYMHMLRRSPLKVGQVIDAGTPVGRVGNTGQSSGCHLHFEYWIGPWQTGGHPIDPLPYLRSLLK